MIQHSALSRRGRNSFAAASMNSNPPAQGGSPLSLDKIIKPEQVQNLGFLSDEEKGRYHVGIVGLWKKVNEYPPGHPERNNAHLRLSDVTNKLRQRVVQWRQNAQMAAQNGRPPPSMAQPEAAMQAPAPDPRQAGPTDFSARVKEEAKKLLIVVPMSLRSRSQEEQQQWITQQRVRYAQILQRFERAEFEYNKLQQQAHQRQRSTGLTAEESHNVNTRLQQYMQIKSEAQNQAMAIKQQHETVRRQMQAQYANAQQAAAQAAMPNAGGPQNHGAAAAAAGDGTERSSSKPEEQSKPTMQRDENAVAQPAGTMQGSSAQAQGTQNQNQQVSAGAPAETMVKPEPSNTGAQASPPNNTPAGPAKPLSHQDAIMRASQNLPQVSQAAHGQPGQSQAPVLQREQTTPSTSATPRPPMRPLNVNPNPTPVQMPSARPTITGGPGPAGPMGQPALQKHPGYVLEGEGERVLSKKKLEELVRQVTGGSGSGEGGEALDPDVEEVWIT